MNWMFEIIYYLSLIKVIYVLEVSEINCIFIYGHCKVQYTDDFVLLKNNSHSQTGLIVLLFLLFVLNVLFRSKHRMKCLTCAEPVK